MSRFTAALHVSPLANGKSWILREPFSYDIEKIGSGETIIVKEGFTTDFASIPRVLWIFFPRWGKYGNAAVVHDWLYWEQDRSRKASDDIMSEAMGVLGVSPFQKYPIYWAVRLFGGIAWKRNQWDKKAGFSRVETKQEFKSTDKPNRPGVLKRAMERMMKGEKPSEEASV